MIFIKTNLVLFFFLKIVLGQVNTEVYLFDLRSLNYNYQILNPLNISNSKGYDNQPSFLNTSDKVLFSSNRNGQTDIIIYDIKTQKKKWLTETVGSEYSPIQINSSNSFSTVRLDVNGDQLLYKYDMNNDTIIPLIPNLKIGYYGWVNDNQILSFVLGDPPSMQSSFLKEGINKIIVENIGRSFYKIPGTNLMSYVKKDSIWSIISIDLKTGYKEKIIETLEDSEDFTWTPDKILLMGHKSQIFKFDPRRDNDWILVKDLSSFELNNISRIAVSNNGKRLAIVVDDN